MSTATVADPGWMTVGMIALLVALCAPMARAADESGESDKSVNPYADETPAERDARMAWWRDARFGMFIHWGVYAVPAGTYDGKRIGGIGEWIMNRGKIPVERYRKYAAEFNPAKYDPDAWVRLAKDAGMKYIVITSKHHDGFALFDSKVTEWDVVDATPYGKDLLKPLAEACRKHGLKLGFYYSQAQDWNHPGGAASGGHWDPAQEGDMTAYIRRIAVPQVKEILTNYGKLGVLWWDTPTDMTRERADMLLPLIELQPGILTNNRLGGGYRGDFSTPEQHIPATGLDYDWETCMTMNDTWGFKSYDDNWKSARTLIRNLIDTASKGGNYLLNVGPTAEGEIPQPSIERLRAVGKWMDVNGEAIYGTTASPFRQLAWGKCTKKLRDDGSTLYLHVLRWPDDATLEVPGLNSTVRSARLLDGGQALRSERTDTGWTIHVPEQMPDEDATVIAVDVAGELTVEPIAVRQDDAGKVTLHAVMADIHNPGYGKHAQLEGPPDRMNIGFWTDARTWVAWAFLIDRPGAFEVYATTAAEQEVKGIQVTCGEQRMSFTAPKTGDWGTYERVRIGQIRLEASGKYSLSITPDAKQWRPINVRRIELVPADQ